MAEPWDYHELVEKLIKDSRQQALVGLWCDILEQLPALRSLAVAELRRTPRGAMSENLRVQRDILRDLFRQVDGASRGKPKLALNEPTLETAAIQSLCETAGIVREQIIVRTKEQLTAIVDEGQRDALRQLMTEISGEFDERR